MSSDPSGIPCMLMRGGTSKGAFFLADDLPREEAKRDGLLLRIMGSPDPRQIDGVGGAHPLTTKVAVVGASEREDIDVEYLFLQVSVDRPEVTDRQNCGNMLAAVGPFALERGLVSLTDGPAPVRILMKNTGGVAVATFPVEAGRPVYAGETEIAGVPGGAAEILIEFEDIAGSSTGALLPTGRSVDEIEGLRATLIDNGMPVVVLRASDVGLAGDETCEELEGNADLRQKLEEIRLVAGPLMNLGDVSQATVPKLTLVSPPRMGGAISTRTFIPHRCHQAIGVLGAVSVATACLFPESPAAQLARLTPESDIIRIEHPTGSFDASIRIDPGPESRIMGAGIIRTARKLMDGLVFPRRSRPSAD
ncbi:MAG TPA: 4-oxalomesaconate tautomerase [Acidimicrobiia bacterium]|nr:4-oxalomesaconate tautomerase [Acidimicrobiia bacterium]